MTVLLMAWLYAGGAYASHQAAEALSFDVRVFAGTAEVTADTIVSVFDAGSRTNPRRMPLAADGERRMSLPMGQYDVQLVQQDEGQVRAVRWTSLRLLVNYPGEYGRHLEVFNLQRGFGALQVRQAGVEESGRVGWRATLRPAGGGDPVSTAEHGDGYVLFVAPPGRYDVEISNASGAGTWIRGAEIHEDLTYLKSWTR
jgi:hypothetical protein